MAEDISERLLKAFTEFEAVADAGTAEDAARGLDEATLQGALGPWVGKGEIKAILERRDKMGQVIEKLRASGGGS